MNSEQAWKILNAAVDRFGYIHQILQAIEALDELGNGLVQFEKGAITGAFINGSQGIEVRDRAVGKVTQSMADVEIAMEQLRIIFKNTEAVERARDWKLERLKARLSHR